MAASQRMTTDEVVAKLLSEEHVDLVRESLRWVVQQLMEAEVSELIGAEHGEAPPTGRPTATAIASAAGTPAPARSSCRFRSCARAATSPPFLEPRKRSERALLNVVQRAYRDGGRVARKCLVIAHGVHQSGRREVIGLDVGEAETEAFWRDFLRGLVKRGLAGVQLAISDAHEGLKAAIAQVLGCPWQRCTVHFLRDCLGHARREEHGALAALIRPIFNQASQAEGRDRLSEAVAALDGRLPKVCAALERAEEDILAFYAFPADHWTKLRSTNPLERLNREIGRRTDVVGIFPDDASLIRLTSMLAIEQNDEWLVGRRYLSAGSMTPLLEERGHRQDEAEVRELQAA